METSLEDVEVTADSSIHQIEDEVQYYHTLLQTLDTEAADYESDRKNYEHILHTMESWKAQKSQPLQDHTATPQSHRSAMDLHLPSRERNDRPQVQDSYNGHHTSDESDNRKRGRHDTTTYPGLQARKVRRLSDSLSASSDGLHGYSGTPSSSQGHDSDIQRASERQAALERQRQQEERFRREKADEEFAKRLHQAFNDSTEGASGRSMHYQDGARLSQALISADGYRRRSMSPVTRRVDPEPVHPAPVARTLDFPVPTVPPTLPPTTPARPSNPPQTTARGSTLANDHMSARPLPPGFYAQQADSPPSMVPRQNTSSVPDPYSYSSMSVNRLPQIGSGLASTHGSRYAIPGAYPQDSTRPAPHPAPMPTGEMIRSMLPDRGTSIMGSVTNAASAIQNYAGSSAGASNWGRYGGYISSDEDEDEDMFDHDGYNGYGGYGDYGGYGHSKSRYPYDLDVTHMNAKTKQDLEALLENIRPDEELERQARLETPSQLSVTLMKHQRLGLTWLKNQEEGPNKGAILADDMGLGKTVQALALIVARPSTDPFARTTLIIAPVALLKQWEREIDDKVKSGHKLKVFIYHGPKRATFAKLAQYDVVLTTLGKLGSEVKKKEALEVKIRVNPQYRAGPRDELCLLGDRCKWWRVIIDEAQSIKNSASLGAKAAQRLDAVHRLCMTGTPMMNNVKELWSLVHFLRIKPYNEWEKFRNTINLPLEDRDPTRRDRGMKALQALLKAILLRRTKKSKIDGEPILKDLPDRSTVIDNAMFDNDQEDFYKALEQKIQVTANRYLQPNQRLKNYANVLVLLLRLRQACDHPFLISEFEAVEPTSNLSESAMEAMANQLSEERVNMIKSAEGAFECPICMDATENPTIFFPCGHDVCAECFTRLMETTYVDESTKPRCPECRTDLDAARILTYTIFKKVHMPDAHMTSLLGGVAEAPNEQEAESESDSDSDDEKDANSQGDLRDFIVNDDESIESEDEEDGENENGIVASEAEESDGEFRPAQVASTTRNARRGKRRFRGDKKKDAKKNRVTLAELKKQSQRNAKAKKKYLKRLDKQFKSSAKIDKMMSLMDDIWAVDPTEKIIIFSQFTSFLDLAEIPMYRRNIGYRRYDGSMKPADRDEAVQVFSRQADVRVMLISLKAGNAGLNLTCASQVIILDPFWNPFIEEQAIDRAHRIGQSRHVSVHRILVPDTVEDRIVQLQEKKRQLINEALDEKTSQDMGRLGVQELRFLFGLHNSVSAQQ